MWWDVFDREFLIFLLSTKDQHHLRLRYEVRRNTHDSLFCGLKPQSFVTNTLKLSPKKMDKVKIAAAYFLAILVYRDVFFLDHCCFDHQKEAIQSRSTLSSPVATSAMAVLCTTQRVSGSLPGSLGTQWTISGRPSTRFVVTEPFSFKGAPPKWR